MIYGVIFLVLIIAGFLIHRTSDNFFDWRENVGLFFTIIGIMGFVLWIVFLSIFQINKDFDFQANLIARENIIYAIEHYEDIDDDINLNSTKYELLQKAMDFNQALVVKQAQTKSIFYIWFCNPDYNFVEPIDYTPLVEDR